MSKLKVHYVSNGYGVCSVYDPRETTKNVDEVTCRNCRATEEYKKAVLKVLAKRVKAARISLEEEIDTVTESYAFRQAKWIKDNDIKVGDKVKVLRSVDTEEGVWFSGGSRDTKDAMVGKVYTIDNIYPEDIALEGWYFPYFVLEKVFDESMLDTSAKIEDKSIVHLVTDIIWDCLIDGAGYNIFKANCNEGELYCIEEKISERMFKIKVTEIEVIEKDSNDR